MNDSLTSTKLLGSILIFDITSIKDLNSFKVIHKHQTFRNQQFS